jgi:catechol 2,3-dioxygenase-like lactoylglutathione lyase family enzyme
MAIEGMNHFNVLTDDVEATRRFYVGVLGLEEGYRPPFSFDGLWLYAGGRPILHISAAKLPGERAGVIDHIAFTSVDLKGTIGRLEASHIKYRLSKQVGTNLWQVFCHDPMGARVELDFDGSEPAPT